MEGREEGPSGPKRSKAGCKRVGWASTKARVWTFTTWCGTKAQQSQSQVLQPRRSSLAKAAVDHTGPEGEVEILDEEPEARNTGGHA